ncbi:hypothetical protein Tco_1025737 [Tanacetum coccineum]
MYLHHLLINIHAVEVSSISLEKQALWDVSSELLDTRVNPIKTLGNWLSQKVEKVVNVHKLRMDHEKKTQSLSKLKEELSYLKQLKRSTSQGSRQKPA